MKEKTIDVLKNLIIIFIFAILISIPYLNSRVVFGDDISYHLNRIIEISKQLKLGNIPVLIHPNLLNGFGYANSLFYPELFLYIPAIIMFSGINTFTTYKIFILVINYFTILFTCYSANRIFKNKITSITITILYTTAFYRIVNLYVRSAIGEVLAFTFLPLILAGLYEIIFGDNKNWWIMCFGIF